MLLAAHCYICGDKSIDAALICQPCWRDLITEQAACDKCGRNIVGGSLCSQCLTNPGAIDQTITLFPYRFPATSLLRSLKYKNQLILAHEFGQRLAEKVLFIGVKLPDRIMPVPLHPARLFTRGYNQALEIARAISTQLAVPVDYKSSKRIRNTLPQFNLKPGERRKNIKGAFALHKPQSSGSVAIVDDIVTTGSTANELAKLLKAAGATEVSLWSCAHSD